MKKDINGDLRLEIKKIIDEEIINNPKLRGRKGEQGVQGNQGNQGNPINTNILNSLVSDVNTLKASLARIEKGLFGDRLLGDIGLANKIETSYDYVRKNIESNVVARGETAMKELENFIENKTIILEMVDKYKAIKLFFILIAGGGFLSAISLMVTILNAIQGINK